MNIIILTILINFDRWFYYHPIITFGIFGLIGLMIFAVLIYYLNRITRLLEKAELDESH